MGARASPQLAVVPSGLHPIAWSRELLRRLEAAGELGHHRQLDGIWLFEWKTDGEQSCHRQLGGIWSSEGQRSSEH